MEIRFNVTGTRRKELVGIISEVIGMKAVYKFMPTCAYVIDNLTVSKEGTLIADERTDPDTIRRVSQAAEAAGFKAESIPEELLEQPTAEDATSAKEEAPNKEPDGLVVSMPLEGFTEGTLDNLCKLMDSNFAEPFGEVKSVLAPCRLMASIFILYALARSEGRMSFRWMLLSTSWMTASSSFRFRTITGMESCPASSQAYFRL